jgi:hypothetical protein
VTAERAAGRERKRAKGNVKDALSEPPGWSLTRSMYLDRYHTAQLREGRAIVRADVAGHE